MAQQASDLCLRVLKETNKSRFDSYSVRNSVFIISHITFQDCHVHFFCDNFSQNGSIQIISIHLAGGGGGGMGAFILEGL